MNPKNIMRIIFFYCFAGGLYMTMELIYRQFTDYHMFYLAGLIGGILFLLINEWMEYDTDFLLQVLLCGTAATFAELICGLLFNSDYSIWDYRNLPFNFMGQIQLYFALLWYVFAFIFIPVLDYIDYSMFPRKGIQEPYYNILGKKIYLHNIL